MEKQVNTQQRLKILSLEDSKQDFEIIYELLTEEGFNFRMERVENQNDFISALQNCTYSIILSDFKLPGFNSFGALEIAQQLCPEVPFIVVSGSIGEETAIELIKHGAVDYVLKDKPERLPFAVKRALDEVEKKKALLLSEKEFHLLAESMPQIVWISRADGWNIYFNQNWVDYTGLTLEESSGEGWSIPFHPDDRNRAIEAWQNAVNKTGIYSIECRLRRKDGVYHWWLIRGEPVYNDEHKISKWFGTYTNIHDIKNTQEALIISEQRNRIILETTLDGFIIVDSTGRFTEVNNAYCQLIGYSREEILTKYVHEIEVSEPKEEVMQRMQRIVQNGYERFESNHRSKDGRIINVEVSANYLAINQIFFIFIHDITERIQVENELRDSRALYLSFVDHIPAGVFRKNFEGRYIFVNPIFCQLKGLTEEEIIGKTALELAHYQSTKKTFVSDAKQHTLIQGDTHHELILKTAKPVEVEEVYLQPDGSTQYLQVIKSPVFSANGTIIGSQGILFDITNLKLTEQALFESDRQQATLISNLPGFVYRCANDQNWTMEFISEGCESVTGYTPDDFINNKKVAYIDIIHPDYIEVMIEKWDEMIHHNKVFKEEYPIITANGEIRWVWEQGRGIFNESGVLLNLEGFITDVTERKQAEKALQDKMDELMRFQKLTVGREISMIELKAEVNELLLKLGQEAKYKIVKQ